MGMIIRQPVVDQCKGCGNVLEDGSCYRYAQPAAWWRAAGCPMHTENRKVAEATKKGKKRAGQQHQRKSKALSPQQAKSYSRISAR